MTDQPFDQVAVALTGDLTDLMSKMEEAATEAERAGEEAGVAFHDSLTENLGKAGDIVRQMAEQMGTSFQEVAARLKGEGLFEVFSEEQLTAAAQALDEFAVPLNEVVGPLEEVAELQERLAEILGSETVPALEKSSELVEQVKDIFEEYGLVLGEDMTEGLTIVTELMKQFAEEEGEKIVIDEKAIQGIRQKVEDLALEEAMVKRVVEAYREMGVQIPNALQRDKIRNHVRALREHADQFSDVRKEAMSFTDGMIEQGKALKGGEGILGKVTNTLGQFGINLGGMLPHIAAGTAALGALKLVFNEIKEATDFALKLTESTEEMAAAFRINQLAGEDNTLSFQDWIRTAEEVQKITGQTLAGAMEATSDTLREMGASTELADDQIQDLLLTGAKFTKQYGGTLPQSINQLSGFINTGLSESLRRLGLDLGKQEQNAKAFEMRLGTNIDKLSEADQRLVRYNLLMEELGEKTAATEDSMESFADRIDDVAVRTETAKKTLGDLFVPIVVKLKEATANIKEGFTAVIGLIVLFIQDLIAKVVGRVLALSAIVIYVLDNLGKEGALTLEKISTLYDEAFDTAHMELLRYQVEQATGGMDDYAEATEGAVEVTEDLEGAIAATAEQIDAFIDAARKFDEGMEKIEQKFLDRMDAITVQFTQRRADMEADFLRDLRDIDQDAAEDRLQTVRQYQIDEIRLREDHQLDIRQLEERFILDLEDAVRERDARGVLNLQRRFNLEKKNREEDYLLRQKRLKEDFGWEMMEIARQRLLRRRERHLQYQEELMDLAVQEERKREAARLARSQQERDLLESIKNRLLALQALADGELAIEQALLDNLVEALTATYGPDGPWTLWHSEAVKTANTAAEDIAHAEQQIVNVLAQTEGAIRAHVRFQEEAAARVNAAWSARLTAQAGSYGAFPSSGFQRGGSFVATGPRALTVGEGRPERVDITPLSGGTGQPAAGFRGGSGERVGIDLNVEASDMLVVEVADQTMTEIADVMVNVSSKNYQGGRGG